MKKLISALVIGTAVVFSLSACNRESTHLDGKTFVLVHGAWQAAYVWTAVKQELENRGQDVVTVELPGHGEDFTSPANLTMDVYRDKVIEAISGIKGKVILVGHSMGGVVVSSVAEKIPSRIEKLVYIGAFVPANGQSLLDLSLLDKQSQLGASLIPSKDGLTLDVVHENITSIFCQDAPKPVQDIVLRKFRVEPAIPFINKLTLTDANFGTVDKYYIHTLQDHAIGMDLQNLMVAAAHITNTYSVNTGHSPFLSKPGEVTDLLMKIAK